MGDEPAESDRTGSVRFRDSAIPQANTDAAIAKWPEIASGPVAVEILDLAARLDGHDVLISWRTGREEDVAGFRVLRWLPAYLRWYVYAFATTFLRRGADTVPMKTA